MAPSNRAAFLITKGTPLEVKSSTYTPPGKNQMVVKNGAVAINPFDWVIQETGTMIVPYLKLPFVLGTDVAGEIVEVGSGITRFKVGDRVVAAPCGLDKTSLGTSESGFQEYTVIREHMTSAIPSTMSYESACVIPLGLATAACGLFLENYLGLPLPTTSPVPSKKTLLVWGGSTSVGCNAIQLAIAAGCEVITTASPKNHNYLKRLGATEVFDYNSPTVVSDIIQAFKGRVAAGAISMGSGSLKQCSNVLSKCEGNKFIAVATPDMPPFPKGALDYPSFIISMLAKTISGNMRDKMNGVTSKFILAIEFEGSAVGRAIFEDFLPKALEQDKFIPAPEPHVVGNGLEYIQEAMNLNKKGVSAKKLVVTL